MHGFFVRWKINQYSQLCRYFTSNIYVYILQVWIFFFIDICWNECCLKTYIKRWTYVLEYIFGTWFFDCDYDSTKYKYSQIFFDPVARTRIHAPKTKIFPHCDDTFFRKYIKRKYLERSRTVANGTTTSDESSEILPSSTILSKIVTVL